MKSFFLYLTVTLEFQHGVKIYLNSLSILIIKTSLTWGQPFYYLKSGLYLNSPDKVTARIDTP
jgi:hypothetical protein